MFVPSREIKSQLITPSSPWKTVFLMHTDGANASTTFTESCGKSSTTNGHAVISTSQKKFGTASGYFDGNGDDYVEVPYSDDFAFGSGDFTVSFFINLNSSQPNLNNQMRIVGLYQSTDFTPWAIALGPDFKIFYYGRSSTSSTWDLTFSGNTVLSSSTWHHIALVRYGGALSLFVNGHLDGGISFSGSLMTTTLPLRIMGGHAIVGTAGYIDEIQIVKGKALWKSDFTPPTAAYDLASEAGIFSQYGVDSYTKLLLHCDGVDRGTAIRDECGKTVTNVGAIFQKYFKKFGQSALYFSGGNKYLTVPDSEDFNLGSGNFTVDFWVYYLIFPSSTMTFCQHEAASNMSICMYDSIFYASSNGTTWDICTGTEAFTGLAAGQWQHIAIARNGTSLKGFVNGKQVFDKTTSATIFNSTTPFYIGGNASSGISGYIDEFRFSKGIARWTGDFTPSRFPYGDNRREYGLTSRARRRVILPEGVCIGR